MRVFPCAAWPRQIPDRTECAGVSADWVGVLYPRPLAECVPEGRDYLALEDLVRLREEHLEKILATGDDRWCIGTLGVSIRFIREAYEVEPNESRLVRVTCPVLFFHGEKDALARVEDLRRFERHVRLLGRSNFKFYYKSGMPHGLDLTRDIVLQGKPFYVDLFKELEVLKTEFLAR